MDLVNLLQPLGTAGAIIAAAILLLREMKKLTNGEGLAGCLSKLDSLGTRIDVIEKDVSYIRGRLGAASADTGGDHDQQ